MRQNVDRLTLRDRWKIVEKFRQGMIAPEIVEESSKGNAGSSEDGSTAEDLRVANDLAELG